jgi:hypothetical protein
MVHQATSVVALTQSPTVVAVAELPLEHGKALAVPLQVEAVQHLLL